MILGELAAIGTSFCWSGGSLLFTMAGRLIGSYNLNKLRIPTAAVFLTIVLLFRFGTVLPTGYTDSTVIYLALSGIVGLSIGDTLYFRCLVILGPRIGSLMMAFSPAMTALLAFFFLDERLSLLAMAGMAVTLGGVSWVTTEKKNGRMDNREGSKALGILAGIGGAAGQALGLILAKKGMGDSFDPMSATWIRMVTATAAIWFVAAFRGEIKTTLAGLTNRRALFAILGAAFLGPTIGVWLSLVAVQHTQTGIAATLMSLVPVVIIPLMMIVYRERPSLRSVLGAAIAVIGVAMLFIK